jgi:hypothetical protein
MTRRLWLQLTAGTFALGLPRAIQAAQAPPSSGPTPIEIWKSPTCGCCKEWVAHMTTNGFRPTTHDVADVAPFKRKYGVPASLESCHTAMVGGYAIEGHVPADVIRQALKEKPAIAGLAVPGMPVGSPGMEVPGGRKDKYDIVAFDKAGKTRVYASR